MIRCLVTTFAVAAAALSAQTEPEYKMTTYQVAFLKRGPSWTPQSTPETQAIQDGHMAHIGAMAKMGKLILAGPFTGTGDLRGMFVFKATAEEAKQLAAQDPAIKSGWLTLEWHTWYSAEGITIITEPKGELKK